MTATDGTTDWRMFREFAAVDLTRSFVLSCAIEGRTLLIDVDLYLQPEHPFYEEPRPAQKACIRPAVIEFPHCAAIRSGRNEENNDLAAAAVEIGHGVIKGLRRLADGQYEISGDFGVVLIESERPILRIAGP